MIEKVINKIKSEMESNKDNLYVKTIGEFILKTLEETPATADVIADSDKTILKSLDYMRKEAEKKKTGNFAMLTPEEGFNIVLSYFGLDAKIISPIRQVFNVKESKESSTNLFDIKLEDIMS